MVEKNPKVDAFLENEAQWQPEIQQLRAVMLTTGLDEELKWGQPCYTLKGKNVVLIQSFKTYCALLFVKGVLIDDGKKILNKTGENTVVGRQLSFTSLDQIKEMIDSIHYYVQKAVDVEKAGTPLPVTEAKIYAIPSEFKVQLDADDLLSKAFKGLTPGRQKAYLRYFSEPKKTETRLARIERNKVKILAGKGLTDH